MPTSFPKHLEPTLRAQQATGAIGAGVGRLLGTGPGGPGPGTMVGGAAGLSLGTGAGVTVTG